MVKTLEQKFHKGDLVRVTKDLDSSMAHFTADCEAIVIGSYAEQYGGGDVKSFTLHLKDKGQVSWYCESQLTLIESNRLELLQEWGDALEAKCKQRSDLNWIFQNGSEVLEHPHGASIKALAACFGLTNLWGTRGEGFVYYENAMFTLDLAAPYLKSSDKDGWLKCCKEYLENLMRNK